MTTPKTIVLLGGGHTHALVLKTWCSGSRPDADIVLINPAPSAPYTGMLPGFIAGHYERDELEIDLVHLANSAGATFVEGRCVGIDPAAQTLQLQNDRTVHYDALSIDIGITSNLPQIDGFEAHAVAAKPLGKYAAKWDDFITARKSNGAAAHIAVIGGGVAGVELALAMAYRLDCEGITRGEITLVEAGDGVLRGLSRGPRDRLINAVHKAGIKVKIGATVTSISDTALSLSSQEVIASDFTLSAAGAHPHHWLRETGLPLHEGYICVDETLRVMEQKTIFAVGDCAHFAPSPVPKAGVFAVRQAPILAHNLTAWSRDKTMQTYKPQRDYLKLITMGRRVALGTKFGLWTSGKPLWRVKDRIDRNFMRQFQAPQ